MAQVTDEAGIYDNAGTPQELRCLALVTFDSVTLSVIRIESWENTYPFAWRLLVERAVGQPFDMTLAANSTGRRQNVPAGYSMNDAWQLLRAG